MIEIEIEDLELVFKTKIRRNWKSMGSDTASATGWAIAWTDDKYCYCDCGVIDLKSTSTINRYRQLNSFFSEQIPDDLNRLVIEKPFLKFFKKGRTRVPQVNVFRVLVAVSMIPMFVGFDRGLKNSQIIMIEPTKARSKLNLPATGTKAQVQAKFLLKTGIELEEDNVVDAIILAFVGLLN